MLRRGVLCIDEGETGGPIVASEVLFLNLNEFDFCCDSHVSVGSSRSVVSCLSVRVHCERLRYCKSHICRYVGYCSLVGCNNT